jgi:hypothetical protein
MARQKKSIISNIKRLVDIYGDKGATEWDTELTTAGMQSDSSPVVTNTKGAMTLCEHFGLHKVTVVHYVKDEEVGEDYVPYEELKKDVLEEIEHCIENYVEQEDEDYKRKS